MEIAAGNRVQLETRHGVELPVSLDLLVVDVIVAEVAEEEVRKLVGSLAESNPGCITEPDRRVLQGQGESDIEIAADLRDRVAVDVIDEACEPPLDAFFIVDGAQRAAHVRELEAGVETRE